MGGGGDEGPGDGNPPPPPSGAIKSASARLSALSLADLCTPPSPTHAPSALAAAGWASAPSVPWSTVSSATASIAAAAAATEPPPLLYAAVASTLAASTLAFAPAALALTLASKSAPKSAAGSTSGSVPSFSATMAMKPAAAPPGGLASPSEWCTARSSPAERPLVPIAANVPGGSRWISSGSKTRRSRSSGRLSNLLVSLEVLLGVAASVGIRPMTSAVAATRLQKAAHARYARVFISF